MKTTRDNKKGKNGTTFDFSGMKEPAALIKDGYQLQTMATSMRAIKRNKS